MSRAVIISEGSQSSNCIADDVLGSLQVFACESISIVGPYTVGEMRVLDINTNTNNPSNPSPTLDIPTNLTVVENFKSANISWDNSSGATSYTLRWYVPNSSYSATYGSSTATSGVIDNITGKSYTHTGLTIGRQYSYSVQAKDNSNGSSLESSQSSMIVPRVYAKKVFSTNGGGYSHHHCAQQLDDTLYCWSNDSGLNGYTNSPYYSVLGMNGTQVVKQVNVVGNGICYVRSNDTVGCAENSFVQSTLPPSNGNIKKLFTSDDNACIITNDDTVECWGNNWSGENDVPIDLGTVKDINMFGATSCAIKTDDTVRCWGLTNLNISESVQKIMVLSDGGGLDVSCFIRTDNTLGCMGNVPSVVNVPEELGTIKDIRMIGGTICAIKTDGAIQCWGDTSTINPINPNLTNIKDIVNDDILHYNMSVYLINADDNIVSNYDGSLVGGVGTVKEYFNTQYHSDYTSECIINTNDTLYCTGNGEWTSLWGGTPVSNVGLGWGAQPCAVSRDDNRVACFGTKFNFTPMPRNP